MNQVVHSIRIKNRARWLQIRKEWLILEWEHEFVLWIDLKEKIESLLEKGDVVILIDLVGWPWLSNKEWPDERKYNQPVIFHKPNEKAVLPQTEGTNQEVNIAEINSIFSIPAWEKTEN